MALPLWRSRPVEQKSKRTMPRVWSNVLLTVLILAPCWAPVWAQRNSMGRKVDGGKTVRATHLTEKDTVVLADFENKTRDAVFDDALREDSGRGAAGRRVWRAGGGDGLPGAAGAGVPGRNAERESAGDGGARQS